MFLPFLLFLIPGLVCLAVDVYNRYYRQIGSPFLAPGLGFFILSLFFLVQRRWAYFLLSFFTLVYIGASLTLGLWGDFRHAAVPQCYRQWSFDTVKGRIRLQEPLGRSAPPGGAYITCSFALRTWWDFVDNQPNLCTAFAEDLRVTMFLNDQDTDGGILREFQVNQFSLQTKSLLGETLDRGALRLAFLREEKKFRPNFELRAMYQVYEREITPGHSRVIESFSRDGQGKLKSFTESSALNITSKDIFAVYNSQGLLTEIPRLATKSFVFPARIDVSKVERYLPPRVIRFGEPL
ncbi:MAG TPA: hypothetical protein VJP40_00245 [bacterium]|nr:hypothetical protein [bacterium]